MFPVELYRAYPEAKFILTVRDAEKWKRSTEEVRLSAPAGGVKCNILR